VACQSFSGSRGYLIRLLDTFSAERRRGFAAGHDARNARIFRREFHELTDNGFLPGRAGRVILDALQRRCGNPALFLQRHGSRGQRIIVAN